MSSMESLDKLQAELSVNVYGEAFHTLYKLSQDVNVEHAELMAQAMRYVRKEKVEPLEAENAKLRELVRELWEGYNDPRCEECHLKDTPTCADCPICAREALVIDRMRELGVEVDDG